MNDFRVALGQIKSHSIVYVIGGILAALVFCAALPVRAQDDSLSQTQQKQIKISRETTYLLGPLDDEGYVEYIAAANQFYSKGISPENNAAVALWEIVAVSHVPEEHQESYFESLGFQPKTKVEDEFISLAQLSTKVDAKPERPKTESRSQLAELLRQLDHALETPWVKSDCPKIAQWLDLNSRVLPQLLRLARYHQLFEPIVTQGKKHPLAESTTRFLPYDDLAKFMAVKAMNSVQEGDLAVARDSIAVIYRIADLSGQLPQSIHALYAQRIARAHQGFV